MSDIIPSGQTQPVSAAMLLHAIEAQTRLYEAQGRVQENLAADMRGVKEDVKLLSQATEKNTNKFTDLDKSFAAMKAVLDTRESFRTEAKQGFNAWGTQALGGIIALLCVVLGALLTYMMTSHKP